MTFLDSQFLASAMAGAFSTQNLIVNSWVFPLVSRLGVMTLLCICNAVAVISCFRSSSVLEKGTLIFILILVICSKYSNMGANWKSWNVKHLNGGSKNWAKVKTANGSTSSFKRLRRFPNSSPKLILLTGGSRELSSCKLPNLGYLNIKEYVFLLFDPVLLNAYNNCSL